MSKVNKCVCPRCGEKMVGIRRISDSLYCTACSTVVHLSVKESCVVNKTKEILL